VIGFAVLGALGIHLLRRQTAQEFPDVQPGEGMAMLRGAWASMRGRGSAMVHHEGHAQGNGAQNERFDALERLTDLHERGALTDDEFAAEKKLVLDKS
jgi:Short C-terminal domain